ncbi:MAG: hypothetical protein LBJ11_09280 [Oscillospiraceae bacterium]|nr:hypothetical protein [Oscillospiraceae bacterium]
MDKPTGIGLLTLHTEPRSAELGLLRRLIADGWGSAPPPESFSDFAAMVLALSKKHQNCAVLILAVELEQFLRMKKSLLHAMSMQTEECTALRSRLPEGSRLETMIPKGAEVFLTKTGQGSGFATTSEDGRDTLILLPLDGDLLLQVGRSFRTYLQNSPGNPARTEAVSPEASGSPPEEPPEGKQAHLSLVPPQDNPAEAEAAQGTALQPEVLDVSRDFFPDGRGLSLVTAERSLTGGEERFDLALFEDTPCRAAKDDITRMVSTPRALALLSLEELLCTLVLPPFWHGTADILEEHGGCAYLDPVFLENDGAAASKEECIRLASLFRTSENSKLCGVISAPLKLQDGSHRVYLALANDSYARVRHVDLEPGENPARVAPGITEKFFEMICDYPSEQGLPPKHADLRVIGGLEGGGPSRRGALMGVTCAVASVLLCLILAFCYQREIGLAIVDFFTELTQSGESGPPESSEYRIISTPEDREGDAEADKILTSAENPGTSAAVSAYAMDAYSETLIPVDNKRYDSLGDFDAVEVEVQGSVTTGTTGTTGTTAGTTTGTAGSTEGSTAGSAQKTTADKGTTGATGTAGMSSTAGTTTGSTTETTGTTGTTRSSTSTFPSLIVSSSTTASLLATTTAAKQQQGLFEITSVGHGHGVGMSQLGAIAYANQGWDYQKILKHYYYDPGNITIDRRTVPLTVSYEGKSYSTREFLARSACREIGYPGYVPDEAIKAQIVAAFTMACYLDFKVTSGKMAFESAERWANYSSYQSKVYALVDAVWGQYIAYKGGVAQAYYFASSSGKTANVQYMWGNTSVSYLAGGRSSPEAVKPDTQTIAAQEVRAMIEAYNTKNPSKKITLQTDPATWFRVLQKDDGDYVEKIQVGDQILRGSDVRSAIFGASVLKSHAFTIRFREQ